MAAYSSAAFKGPTIDEISENLRQEEEWLNTLTGSLERSDQLKTNMIEILDSFNQRLTGLESTVLPLYEHTGLLQQRQINISKTLKAIDSTLSHYTIVAELDSTLRNTEPSDDMEKYLKDMAKLKEAMKYFLAENAHSNHLENAKGAFEFGCSALEREFKEILRKNTNPIKPTQILDAISDDYDIEPESLEKIDLIPVKSVESLSKIAQWLINNGTSIDFTNFYADNRSLFIQKLLQNIQEHLKSSTPVGFKVQPSPMLSRRDLSTLRSQGFGVAKRISRQYASDLTSRRTTLAVENVTKESSLESEAENFVLTLCSLIAFVLMENDLVQRIFGVQKDTVSKLMRNLIFKPTLYVFSTGENFLVQIQRSLNKQDHAAMLCLFPVAKYLHTNERRFDILLKYCTNDLKNKFPEMSKSVDSLCVKGLEDFVEHVKSDDDKFVPKDGTVHQLTSNALIFLEQLMQVRDCLAIVLAGGHVDLAQGLVPKFFARVLSSLGLNLRNKAELYNQSDPSYGLKAIFMLNNYNHILKTLQKTGLMKIVCEQNREVENYYHEQIKEYKKQYLICWNRILVIFMEYQQRMGLVQQQPVSINPNQKLKDKEREQIKATFSDFNKEFETMSFVQSSYSVPDSDLALQLRKETKELILSKYTWFYNSYNSVNFTKNREKYVKYTPQDVMTIIDRLFMR